MSVATVAGDGDHLVVVVAHPDDESFGCGSLIATAAQAGARISLICATRGERGERISDPFTDELPLGMLREAELCQAALVLGVGDVDLLDYADSGFSGDIAPEALVAHSIDTVADDIHNHLVGLVPDVVLTLDGSDGHRDHVHLRDAVTVAVERLGRPVRLVHSCLARSLMEEWAAVMRANEPNREHLSVAALGRPDDEVTVIDTSAVLAIRERAIACHLSQASPFDSLPPELRRRFLTVDAVVEVTVRMTPAR